MLSFATIQPVLDATHYHVVTMAGTLQRAAEASSIDPMTPLLQYGVLGLVVVAFATGWIVPGPTAKALAAENTRLSELIEKKFFPMAEQYAATMEKAAMALESSSKALETSARALDRLGERERERYRLEEH